VEKRIYFCWYCKRQLIDPTCPECEDPENVHTYTRVVLLHGLKERHRMPGMTLLPIHEVEDIRDGPVVAKAAVARFHALRNPPESTLVFFYPTGLNSLNIEILLGLKDLGYPVVAWYWDFKTQSYF
jgi:hypothetical protein